jgi:hypothetical protein
VLAVLFAFPSSCGKSARVAPHDSGTGGTGQAGDTRGSGTGGGIGGTDASLGSGGISGTDAGMGGMGAGGRVGGAGGGPGGTVSGGGILGTGGRGGTASGGRTVGTGGSAGGEIGGNGGTVSGGSGGAGTGGSGGIAGSDAGQDSNGLCGSIACRYGEYCCQGPCASLCMPEAHPCTGFVCSTNDAGYEVYPSDCQLRVPIGPDAPSCKTEPGRPNYYVCGPSLLGPPCVVQGGVLGSVGGNFCCP